MVRTRQYMLVFGDLLACVLGLTLMLIIRYGSHYNHPIVSAHISSFSVIFVLWLAVFFVFNLYDLRSINPSPRTIGMLGLAMGSAVILGGFAFYLNRGVGIAPRLNLLIVGSFSFVLIVAWRRIFYSLTASLKRSILLIGASDHMRAFQHAIEANPQYGTVTKTIDSFDAIPRETKTSQYYDMVIVESCTPEQLIFIGRSFNTEIRTLIDAHQDLFAKIPISLMTDEYADRILTKTEGYGYRNMKRILEIVVSLSVLIVFSPIIVLACVIKKLEDGGPAILKNHLRVGKNGKPFFLYKIRSMVVNADARGSVWAEHNDPRITPFGKIIRKLHIDEFPQFWNILKGDISLIGPRPEQPKFVTQLEKEIPYYMLRHTIKPGFTGWAQIKFRYARTVMDSKEKWEYDLYYLTNRNLLLDIGILLKTVQIIFTH